MNKKGTKKFIYRVGLRNKSKETMSLEMHAWCDRMAVTAELTGYKFRTITFREERDPRASNVYAYLGYEITKRKNK